MVRTILRVGLQSLKWVFAVVILILIASTISRAMRETATAETEAPSNGYFVNAGDAQIFVQEMGPKAGHAVVLIHGTGTWSEIWRETMTALSDSGFRAIAIDVPPFGYSSKLSGADSYAREMQGQRILSVIRELGLVRPTLVGHSVGARPTLEAALSGSKAIGRLVLVDPALGFDPQSPETPRFKQNDSAWFVQGLFGARIIRDAAIAAYGTNPLFTKKLVSSFVSKKESVTDERVSVIQRPMSVVGTTRAYGDWLANLSISADSSLGSDFTNLKTLSIPTLIIWGETDSITPLWQGKALASMIPESTLSVIEEVGHIPYIENAEAFNRLLIEFLKK